ncbi:MAG: potassium transporter TrkA [Helicobacteraceae bacterium CG2_30_36_10]|nr:MAG: potassium transporter TrkA [Helicobacteraceae bacterium CG2_30_36_10]
MKKKVVLIFGYNDYALEIAKNIRDTYENILIYSLNEEFDRAKNKTDFEVRGFDLSDRWDDIAEYVDFKNSIAFCVLEDSAQNIFLTISLRSLFSDLNIIALSNNKDTANKLQMAGANKVIPLVQTTAEIISEMMEKPIVKEVFHTILFEGGALKITQIEMNGTNPYLGHEIFELDWNIKYGIIPLSVIQEDEKNEFIYASKIKHNRVKEGDIFIIVGYERDIQEFEKVLGRRDDVNWRNWSR